MGSEILFRTSQGGDPVAHILKLRKAVEVQPDDLRYAGEIQKSRILKRTEQGVDVDGSPFKPYSQKGPYYYNPNGRLSGSQRSQISEKTQKGAAKRLVGKLKKGAAGSGAMRLSRTGRTIVFESYAAFKKWLGRSFVDLRGAKAPHMLQAMQVVVRGAKELAIGIYGEAAERAQGHNEGEGHLPKRHFLGASDKDMAQMARDVYARIKARMGAV